MATLDVTGLSHGFRSWGVEGFRALRLQWGLVALSGIAEPWEF